MQWSVYDLGDTAMAYPLTCADVGAGDVVLTMVNQSTQATYTDTFHCASANYDGTSAYVPSGTYAIKVDLYGDPVVYGNSTTLLDELTSTQALVSGSNPLGVIDFMVNSFVLGWSISYGGVSTTCAAAGASWVELDVYFSGQTKATAYFFPCDVTSYRAATTAIPMGSYSVQWQAYLQDAYYNDLTTGTQLMSYSVTSAAQADLGYAYFDF
jgi:hypothetical protein